MNRLVLGDSLDALLDHRGKTPKKLGGDFAPSGVPVASALLVRDGRLDLSEARYVSDEMHAKWMPERTRRGDVILTSEAPAGRVARVDTDDPLVLGQRLFCLRGKAGVLDSGFLYYALQSHAVQTSILGHSTGTTVVGIRQSALRLVQIPAPSFPEQQAIAEVLGALDDKIAANTALAAAADLYASTVLLGSLGAGRVRLASIAHITMGSSPKGDTLNELGQGVPFYQGVRDFGFRSPTRRVFTTAPVRSANAGDILVSVRAPVGDVNVADEPVCIGRGIAAVRSTTGTQATLLHQLKAERDAWEPFEAEGTVFGSINRDQLHGIQVRAVAPERVEFVEEELAAIESSIAAALAENRTLAATRDALLPQLMSGKLRVGDIGRTASGVEA